MSEWNENVQHSKEIALFWRSNWLNNNSPRQGIVADIMQRTKAIKIRKHKFKFTPDVYRSATRFDLRAPII